MFNLKTMGLWVLFVMATCAVVMLVGCGNPPLTKGTSSFTYHVAGHHLDDNLANVTYKTEDGSMIHKLVPVPFDLILQSKANALEVSAIANGDGPESYLEVQVIANDFSGHPAVVDEKTAFGQGILQSKASW